MIVKLLRLYLARLQISPLDVAMRLCSDGAAHVVAALVRAWKLAERRVLQRGLGSIQQGHQAFPFEHLRHRK